MSLWVRMRVRDLASDCESVSLWVGMRVRDLASDCESVSLWVRNATPVIVSSRLWQLVCGSTPSVSALLQRRILQFEPRHTGAMCAMCARCGFTTTGGVRMHPDNVPLPPHAVTADGFPVTHIPFDEDRHGKRYFDGDAICVACIIDSYHLREAAMQQELSSGLVAAAAAAATTTGSHAPGAAAPRPHWRYPLRAFGSGVAAARTAVAVQYQASPQWCVPGSCAVSHTQREDARILSQIARTASRARYRWLAVRQGQGGGGGLLTRVRGY